MTSPAWYAHLGSRHPETGEKARIVDLSGEIRPVERLAALGDLPPKFKPTSGRRGSRLGRSAPEWEQAAEELAGWRAPDESDLSLLPNWQQIYMFQRPGKGWTHKGSTRSEIEHSIVVWLTGKTYGASDEQIRLVADAHFAKHIEERPRQGYAYLERTINSARAQHFEPGWITSRRGGWRRRRHVQHRHNSVEDLEVYLNLAAGQPIARWVEQVEGLGPNRSTAYRINDRLLAAELVRIEDGRSFSYASSWRTQRPPQLGQHAGLRLRAPLRRADARVEAG